MSNSFGSRGALQVGGKSYEIHRLSALEKAGVGQPSKLPFCLKVLLENLLRNEDGRFFKREDIESLAKWDPKATTQKEISFMPARVLFIGLDAAEPTLLRAMIARGDLPDGVGADDGAALRYAGTELAEVVVLDFTLEFQVHLHHH